MKDKGDFYEEYSIVGVSVDPMVTSVAAMATSKVFLTTV